MPELSGGVPERRAEESQRKIAALLNRHFGRWGDNSEAKQINAAARGILDLLSIPDLEALIEQKQGDRE